MIVEIFERLGQVVEIDREFVRADLLGAHRRDEVLPRQRVADIGGREAVGAQRVLVEIDLHLRAGAAVRVGHLRAGRPW